MQLRLRELLSSNVTHMIQLMTHKLAIAAAVSSELVHSWMTNILSMDLPDLKLESVH